MKHYIDVNEALEKILAIISDPELQDADAIENAIKQIPTVEALTAAEAKAMTDKAVNKLKAEAKNEIDAAKAEAAALADELAELKAKMAAEKANEVAPARWIHVSEKLPEEGSLSIAFGNGTKGVTTAYYRAEMNMWKNGTINWWMPMPEAPVEE